MSGTAKRPKTKGHKGSKRHAKTPTKRRAQLQEIVNMPGMRLSQVYGAAARQCQAVTEEGHPGIPQKDLTILADISSKTLQKLYDSGNVKETAQQVNRMQRANNIAEDIRVRWAGVESAVGAAAMQIDGVSRLEELHRKIKLEKKTGHTIDTMPEEEQS